MSVVWLLLLLLWMCHLLEMVWHCESSLLLGGCIAAGRSQSCGQRELLRKGREVGQGCCEHCAIGCHHLHHLLAPTCTQRQKLAQQMACGQGTWVGQQNLCALRLWSQKDLLGRVHLLSSGSSWAVDQLCVGAP